MQKSLPKILFAVVFVGCFGNQSARAEAVKVLPKNLKVGETCAQVYTYNYNEDVPVHWLRMVGEYGGAQTPWWQSPREFDYGDPVGSDPPNDSLARQWKDAYGVSSVAFSYGQEGSYPYSSSAADGSSGGYFVYDGDDSSTLKGYDPTTQKKLFVYERSN